MKAQLLANENPFSSFYEKYIEIVGQISVPDCSEKSDSE